MKNLNELNAYRDTGRAVIEIFGSVGDDTCGVFRIPYARNGVLLQAIATSGNGWDHVSVSLPNRCPTWDEMEHVKRTFFEPDETAMQLHVPPGEHINNHPNTLHLWRPHGKAIPRPPSSMV